MVASSFWDTRLNIGCAATDAEYQNRIILHDNTLNLPVVAQQPIPTPTTRRTRRRTALPAPRGPALAYRSLDTRSSQLCSRMSCLLYGALTHHLHEFLKLPR